MKNLPIFFNFLSILFNLIIQNFNLKCLFFAVYSDKSLLSYLGYIRMRPYQYAVF